MPKKLVIIELQNNCIFILLIFWIWNVCCATSVHDNYTTTSKIITSNPLTHSEMSSAIIPTDLFTIPKNLKISEVDSNAESLHITATTLQLFGITSSSGDTLKDNEENETISPSFGYGEVDFANEAGSGTVSPSSNLISSAASGDSKIPVVRDVLSHAMATVNVNDSSEASLASFLKNPMKSDLLPNYKMSIRGSVIITNPVTDSAEGKTSQRPQVTPAMVNSTQDVKLETVNDAKVPNNSVTSNLREINSSTSFVPNHTNATSRNNSVNATKHYVIEPSKDKHILTIIISVIGSLCALSIGLIAAYYRWRLAGRRRKVYFSHHGEQPKDFAEDTRVRSPVLLPDEIEMQVGRSTSLRVRRAVVLATDPSETELGLDAVVSSQMTQPSSDSQAIISATPPPPPYRTPPPYLPDMIIENIHAL